MATSTVSGDNVAYYERAPKFATNSASNSPLTLAISGVTDHVIVIKSISWGYDGNVSGTGLLTISIAGTTCFQLPAASNKDKHTKEWTPGLHGSAGQAVSIALPASGNVGVSGYINVMYYLLKAA